MKVSNWIQKQQHRHRWNGNEVQQTWYQTGKLLITAVSLIAGGNRSTRRKPPTCRKSLTNFIT
jgi:hypothetical protein